ncbi:MAG TPA: HAD-IA family hydrolase [Acidimicrobiales bacterium]|nr:HAD-IA family hydrolase [Acidimicrobiales bacterium]
MTNTPDVKAVLWDFGGVLTTSPFDAFARYEADNGLEAGFIRRLNATNPDTNAWARFERSEVTAGEFAALFEAEAAAAGATVDAVAVMGMLRGAIRPAMVEAVRRCGERLRTGLLTNNFVAPDPESAPLYDEVLHLFDAVVESSKVGHRKPDPRFYEMACEMLGIEPAEAVFLDDLGVNLKPARAMGMRTIKVVDPAAALSELQAVVGFPVA